MLPIIKKEVYHFFSSLIGLISIGIFIVVNSLFLFILPDTNILDFGYLSMDIFFSVTPFLFIQLIPALCMRMFSEEFKSGTFENLVTKPITLNQIYWAKFISVWIVTIIALLPTLVYVYTLINLADDHSHLDIGATTLSYIGLLFLAACFIAINLFASIITNSSVVAFLVGVFLSYILFSGVNELSRLNFFKGKGDFFLQKISLIDHYESISRGVLDSRDIIYFILFVSVFYFFSIKKLKQN